ncbi:YdbH domain-containing protein [Shewanella khirikhana]|uniref:YdbH domain-containing protein n=1 Tax=Shewanella khirikhana TaxID=1965282 RepID=UPI0030CC6BAB
MAKRAVRLIGILLFSLMLLIAGTAAVLWYQGKDWLTSLARSELAKSGVTLNSLAWRLEPHGVTIENLNLDIEDSRLQLAGLRITFDKPLTALAMDAARGYWQNNLSLPLPQSIGLEQSYVFLGSRSLMAAGTHQADDRAALALDLDQLPHIALGPIDIDTQQGKLLRLDYLSLSEDRRLFSRIANPDGDKILDLNATLGEETWQTALVLSLPAGHNLLKRLADTALPITPDNPLFGFLQQLRLLESKLGPVIQGDLTLQSSLTLKTAALASELHLKDASLSLGALDSLSINLSDTELKANVDVDGASMRLSPLALTSQLSKAQRRALLNYLQVNFALAPESVTTLQRINAALFAQSEHDSGAIDLELGLPRGLAMASGQPISTEMTLQAHSGPWQLGLSASPVIETQREKAPQAAPQQGAQQHWLQRISSPVDLSLSHSGELDVSQLLSALGVNPGAAEPNLNTPQVSLSQARLVLSAELGIKEAEGDKGMMAKTATASQFVSGKQAETSHSIQVALNTLELNLAGASVQQQVANTDTQLIIGSSKIRLANADAASFILGFAADANGSDANSAGDLARQLKIAANKAGLDVSIEDISLNQKAIIGSSGISSSGMAPSGIASSGISASATGSIAKPDAVKSEPAENKQTSDYKLNKLDIASLSFSTKVQKPFTFALPRSVEADGKAHTAGGEVADKPAAPVQTPLLTSLLAARPELDSTLTLSRIKALSQAPRSAGSKRLKTNRFNVDWLQLKQQLTGKPGLLQSQEQWQLGQYQPIRLVSEHRLGIKADSIQTINANWQGDNSLANWREALAGSLSLSSDIPLSGDTRVTAGIALDLIKQTTDIQLNTHFSELEGSVGAYPFHGGNVSASCALHQDKRQDNDFRLGCDKLSWSLAHFQPGIILSDVSGQGTLALQSADDGTLSEFDIDLTSRGKLLEGEFLLPLFKLNLKQPSHAYLVLTGLSLEELLALQPVEGIKADGLFDGVLPVDMRGGKVSVSGGRLAARAPGGLIEVSNNPAVDELVASQPHLALVFDALKHLEYSSLAGSFDMSDNGDALINVEVKGKSEGIERPIHLNYSHEENLLQLIRSLTIGDKLQSHIEQSVN